MKTPQITLGPTGGKLPESIGKEIVRWKFFRQKYRGYFLSRLDGLVFREKPDWLRVAAKATLRSLLLNTIPTPQNQYEG
jgi:hypothetical protein